LIEQDALIGGSTLRAGLSRSRDILGDEVMQVIFRYLERSGFRFSSDTKYPVSRVSMAIRDILGDYGTDIIMKNLVHEVDNNA
jgi:hypothetical protein